MPSESIYERELKRRLWYCILSLDAFCAVDRISEPLAYPSYSDRPLPSNVNDEDFDIDSVTIEPHKEEVTDMTYALLVFELTPIVDALCTTEIHHSCESWEARLAFTKSHLAAIEKKYLQPCDSSNSFQRVILATGYLAQSSMTLRAVRPTQKHKLSKPPRTDSIWILQLAVDHLRRVDHMWTDSEVAQWHRLPWVPWHAIAIALAGLCSIRANRLAHDAWYLVERVMNVYKHHVADEPGGMLWRPILKLRKKAKEFQEGSSAAVPTPISSHSSNSVGSLQNDSGMLHNAAHNPPNSADFYSIPAMVDSEPTFLDLPIEDLWFDWDATLKEMADFEGITID